MVSVARETASGARESQERKAFEAFVRIAELWNLTADQQVVLLGSPARSTFFKWKKGGGQLPGDTVERISHVLNIYKCLTILFPDPLRADAWVRRPNRFWNQQSALERMMSGTMADIIDVRRYLDAQRGG